jgi:arylsulfatase A-like enzyme
VREKLLAPFLLVGISALALGSTQLFVAELILSATQSGSFALETVLGFWAQWIRHHFVLLWPLMVFLLLGTISSVLKRADSPGSKKRALWSTFSAAGLAMVLYTTLAAYGPFAAYWPIKAVCLVLFLIAAIYFFRGPLTNHLGRKGKRLAWMTTVLLLFSGLGIYWHNATTHQNRYPTLHLFELQMSLALFFVAWVEALGSPQVRERLWAKKTRWAWAGIVSIWVAVAMVSALINPKAGRSLFHHDTLLGQSNVISRPGVEDLGIEKTKIEPDSKAVERFANAHRLPELPGDFQLAEKSILLITIEAFRFDQSSLASEGISTTPHLKAFADQGAFVFERAYSPSCATLDSMASLHTMLPPSMIPLETWERPWNGALDEKATTVAELLSPTHHTFAVMHNFKGVFDRLATGLRQGFQQVESVYEPGKPRSAPDTDQKIADKAINVLRAQKGGEKPFFGWIFFPAPHAPYMKRYEDMPAKTALDRYRHELRYVDEMLSRVLNTLREEGLLENTVVIITGDHGEEFGEHGGQFHWSVYRENLHVPLVVWVPNLPGERIFDPTSVLYTFPWLLLHGDENQRGHVEKMLANKVGPLLKATGNAVLAEMIAHGYMRSTLITPRFKLNYDFRSGKKQLFDLGADPMEKHDLARDMDPWPNDLLTKLDGYRRVRKSLSQYQVKPWKRPAPKKRKSQGR